MSPGNLDKTKSAPVTVIIATDNHFYENMPKVFPNKPDAKEMFAGNAGLAAGTASRNGTLGGAYFMIAAKACGLAAVDLSSNTVRNVSETKTAASVAEPVTANVPTPESAGSDNAAKAASTTASHSALSLAYFFWYSAEVLNPVRSEARSVRV
jgi:hypothetical protein